MGCPLTLGGGVPQFRVWLGRPRNRQVFSRSRAVFDRSNSSLSITLGQRLFSRFLKMSRERQSGAGVDAECLLLLQRELLLASKGAGSMARHPLCSRKGERAGQGRGYLPARPLFLRT